MIKILGFYKGDYNLLWVRFVENGRCKLSNGFSIYEETPSRRSDLRKANKFYVGGLLERLHGFYPDHELTKMIDRMKFV